MTAHFLYRATDSSGLVVNGSVEATDRSTAIRILRERSLLLLDVRESSGPERALSLLSRSATSASIPQKELAFIARQLAGLLRAGSDLDRALTILLKLCAPKSATIMQRVHQALRSGRSFADGLAAEGRTFPEFFISMVRAGEASGSLGTALQRLADIIERQLQTRSRLISASIYPAILLTATLASVFLIVTVVVPQFEPIFEQAKQDLPGLTKFVIVVSRITLTVAPFLLPILALTVALILNALRRDSTKLKWHRHYLSLPLFGNLALKIESARFAHTMGALLQGGVPLLTALPIARDSLSNRRLQVAVRTATDLVRDGTRLAVALERQGVFPSLLIQLLAVGEEGAQLGETMTEVGRLYDDESEAVMQRLVTIVTPAATIFLGGIVALVLASVLLAVLKVNDLAF